MNEKQIERLEEAPESCRAVLRRAYGGKSKAAALKAFCLQCVGYVRKDVTECTALGCPLWMVRPYQKGDDDEGEADAADA